MKIKKVTAIFFSPTSGTSQYVRLIAEEIDRNYTAINLTDREMRKREYSFNKDEFVIIGVPVYYGRVPEIPGGILTNLHGDNTPAVLVLSYGNREYDDALIELNSLSEKQGFYTIAAGTFIAPHTFSNKIGHGRPNLEDINIVSAFGKKIIDILENENLKKLTELPGNFPYREYKTVPFSPKGVGDNCIRCMACVKKCPVGAIEEKNTSLTNTDICIRCMLCVRNCPKHSRKISGPIFSMAVKNLEGELLKRNKKSELFLPL